MLAGLAWWGLSIAVLGDGEPEWMNLTYFTQISGLLVALTTTGSLLWPLWHRGELEPRRGVLRGMSAACSMLTLIVFATLLGADYSTTASLLLHLVVPVGALLDWMLVGRNQGRVPGWVPLLWLVAPLAYLPLYVWATAARGGPLYDFLVPGDTTFLPVVGVLLIGFVVLFYLYWGIGRARRRILVGAPR